MVFHFSSKNAQLVLCLSVLFAFLCSSWIFQRYRTSVYRELAGPTTTKETTRVCSTDQGSAQPWGSCVSCNAHVSSGLICPFSALQILPELWKFKSDSWACQVGRARMRNAEILIPATCLLLGVIQDFKHHLMFPNFLTSPHRKDPILPSFNKRN